MGQARIEGLGQFLFMGYVFHVVNVHNLLVLGSPSRFSCQDLR